eukprot:1195945-Prorocentrum_minimum.AAC.1
MTPLAANTKLLPTTGGVGIRRAPKKNLLLAGTYTCRGDQSHEGRENIPVGGASRVRGERIYLSGGPVV